MSHSGKLSPETEMFLALLSGDEDPEVSVFVQFSRPPTPEDRRALEALGGVVHTLVDDTVTVTLPARRLPTVATVDSVRWVEIGQPVHPTARPAEAPSPAGRVDDSKGVEEEP